MDIQTIISTFGLLGIGGIMGSYFQYLLNKKETELKIQQINENRYRSTLVYMRCLIEPKSLPHFQLEDKHIYELKDTNKIKQYAKEKITEYYYNGFLYASDSVLTNIKQFLKNSSTKNFTKTAVSMRKDLWKKGKTKINANDFILKF